MFALTYELSQTLGESDPHSKRTTKFNGRFVLQF